MDTRHSAQRGLVAPSIPGVCSELSPPLQTPAPIGEAQSNVHSYFGKPRCGVVCGVLCVYAPFLAEVLEIVLCREGRGLSCFSNAVERFVEKKCRDLFLSAVE